MKSLNLIVLNDAALVRLRRAVDDELIKRKINSPRSYVAGMRIGKLKLLEFLGKRISESNHYSNWFKCQCDCGAICERANFYFNASKERSACPACAKRKKQSGLNHKWIEANGVFECVKCKIVRPMKFSNSECAYAK